MNFQKVFWADVTQLEGNTYESCRFHQVSFNSVCPDFEFEVRLEDPNNQDLLSRVSIITHADHQVCQFVQSHPQWQKDCRPFILMNIHELMWQQKLLKTEFRNPSKTKFGFAFKQGGTLSFDITAEVLVDCGGTTIIQLVNYANTHVFDQLKEVYKVNPTARPSQQYVEAYKQNFFRDNRKKKKQKKKEQKHRLKLYRKKQVKHEPVQIFIDESGDIGFRSLQEPYVINAYVLPLSAVEHVRQALKDIRVQNWHNTPPKELHFNKIPISKRQNVIADVAKCFRSVPATCLCYIGDKSGFLAYLLRCEAENRKLKDNPIITSWPHTLNKSPTLAGRETLVLLIEELLAHIAIEVLDPETPAQIVHDRKHRKWMNDALKNGFQRSKAAINTYSTEVYGTKLPLSRSFETLDSTTEACLWVSDWICWEISKWVKGQSWSVEFEKSLSKIRFITFDPSGQKVQIDKPQGEMLNQYPDRPREIGVG